MSQERPGEKILSRHAQARLGRLTATVALAALLFALWRVVPALACLSGNGDSVHFNSGQPDFGLPPRRAVVFWRSEDQARPLPPNEDEIPSYSNDGTELDEDKDQNRIAERLRRRGKAVSAAREALQSEQWRKARICYAQAANLGDDGSYHDRVEVLRRMESEPARAHSSAFVAALRAYMDALDEISLKPGPANAAFAQVYANPAADFLREHALYQQASAACNAFDYARAIGLYQRLLQEFPKTAKREEALMMIARSALLPATAAGRDLTAGRQAIAQLRAEFPHSRFRHALRGLDARLHYLAQEWRAAVNAYFALGDLPSVEIVRKAMPEEKRGPVTARLLAAYFRRLAQTPTFYVFAVTLRLIDHLEDNLFASPADDKRFSQSLIQDTEVASSYLYYHLYHRRCKPSDLAEYMRLADAIAAHHAADPLSPLVRVRLAEVYYRKGQYDKALLWADRAAHSGDFDRALYVRGATLQKLKKYRRAQRDFRALLAHCPRSPLRHATRENLAILCETLGDLQGALEQYFLLDYQMDIAYLLDARMSLPQVEAFQRSPAGQSRLLRSDTYTPFHSEGEIAYHYPQRDLILYSLGIRYLRAERWRAAERILRRVPPATYKAFSQGRLDWASRPSPDPITAARQLGRLHRAIARARPGAARANALFQYGYYYSTHGTLLLYNPALWRDQRAFGFDFWWNERCATRQDQQAQRRHMYDHEVYARSREILLQVAHRYPRASVAPAALYYAGYAARYMAHFNLWWDEEEKSHHFWNEAISHMKQVARRYPQSPYAHRARVYLAANP